MSIINDFVDNPGAVLDTDCADDEKPLPFVMPETSERDGK